MSSCVTEQTDFALRKRDDDLPRLEGFDDGLVDLARRDRVVSYVYPRFTPMLTDESASVTT
jgi:hypothetical protein